MTRSARRSAWAARPRAVAATVGLLATLLVLGPVLPAAGAAPPAPARSAAGPTEDGGGSPAGGDDPDGEVRVVLDDVQPVVPRVGEPLRLRGRVVNDSPQRRRLTEVTVRAAWAPLVDRADVTHWLEGRDRRETGWVLGQDAIGPVVVPGADVPFSVQVPEHALDGLPGGLAALALEIEATGEQEPGSPEAPAVEPEPVVLRTVLTAARQQSVADPLDVSWVVPLTLPPDPDLTSTDDRRRRAAWYAATGPGSPARTWLENLTLDGATWMVDPTMLVPVEPADDVAPPAGEPAEEPAPGDDRARSTAQPGDDAAVTGTGPSATDDAALTSAPDEEPDRSPDDGEEPVTREEVREGLVALRSLLAGSAGEQLWWTPVGDPDVAALLAQQTGTDTVEAAMTLPLPQTPEQVERLLRRGRSDVAWPALAAPSLAEVAALDRFWASRPATPEGAAAVVVPRESLSGGSNTSVDVAAARVSGAEDVTALGADTRGAALLAGAREDSVRVGEGAVVQRLLADSLTAYQQDPLADRSMLYAPPRGSAVPGNVLTALTDGFRAAPWAHTVAAVDLLADASDAPPVALSGVAPAGEVLGGALVDRVLPAATPLDAQAVRDLARLDASLAGLSQVLSYTGAVATWEPVLSHLWSTRWRGAVDGWREAWQDARRPVTRAQEAVHVNPSTVNFLSDEGLMQVTVVNDLPVAVEGVIVELVPDGGLLRVVEQPEPISIGAESRATVSFTARAVTRGVTTVSARLTTPNGTVLGDDEAQVSVRVQPTGVWIYWVLGSAAGLVLVLGLVRARRTAPRAAAVAAPTTTSEENR